MLKWVIVSVVAVAIGLPLGARADLTEAERQERCANNAAAIEKLRTELQSNRDFRSDEEIARLRAELRSIRSVYTRWGQYKACLNDVGRTGDQCDAFKPSSDQLEYLNKQMARYSALSSDGLEILIGGEIDDAVAARPRLVEINQQLSFHQNRLVELQCASTPERTTEPQTASKPSDTESSETGSSETGGSCGLGKRWQMRAKIKDDAGLWTSIVWTRQGDSSRWTGVGFAAAEQITVSLSGDRVTFTSTKPLLGMFFDDGDQNCTYHGTLQGSAITEGTGECTPAPIAFDWEATVECQ